MNRTETNDQGEARQSPRSGSNRPGEGETIIHARLTLAQREKFRLLGGQHWLQMMIDAAPRQPKFYSGEDRVMSMFLRTPGTTNSQRQR